MAAPISDSVSPMPKHITLFLGIFCMLVLAPFIVFAMAQDPVTILGGLGLAAYITVIVQMWLQHRERQSSRQARGAFFETLPLIVSAMLPIFKALGLGREKPPAPMDLRPVMANDADEWTALLDDLADMDELTGEDQTQPGSPV